MNCFSAKHVNDCCWILLNRQKVISVHEHETKIRIAHDFVGIAASACADFARADNDNHVALEQVSEADFLRDIFQVDPRPKAVFPKLALAWENLLWGCANCNRRKGNQFPPDTRPGARLINPVEENVWDFFIIDRFGNFMPQWRPDKNTLDERAAATRDLLQLNRETLQARRMSRLNDLRHLVNMTLKQFRAGEIQIAEVHERSKEWRSSPTQPDVADFFINGPGSVEKPFSDLLSVV